MEGTDKIIGLINISETNETFVLNQNESLMHNCTKGEECLPGTIFGHVVASISWFSIGFLYTIMAVYKHYACKRDCVKFKSAVEFPMDFLPGIFRHFPGVALVKLTGATTFLISSLVADIEPNTEEMVGQYQHELMSFMFIISGGVDIITAWASHRNRMMMVLPDGTDYLVFAATFFIEFYNLSFHLHGRHPADARLHALMATTALWAALALLLEASYREHAILPMIRGFCIMLQGTWVMNLLIVLYQPGTDRVIWDLDAEETVGAVSLMFVWNIIMNVILILVVNIVIAHYMTTDSLKSYIALPGMPANHCSYQSNNVGGKWQLLAMEQTQNGQGKLLTHGKTDKCPQGCRSHKYEDFDGDSDLEFEQPVKVKSRTST